MVRYQVRLYNTSGSLVAIFDDWSSLEVNKRINNFDVHTFMIDGRDSRVSLFTLDSFVHVQRKDDATSLPWTTEYFGFHRTSQRQFTEVNKQIFTSYGRGLLDLARRAIVLYPSGSTGSSKSGAAETVMKEFVNENIGPGAIAPRLYSNVMPGLTIAADSALGGTWSGSRAWRNLLEVLQDIANANGIDFNIVNTGPATFEFRTYYPQLGTDHSITTGTDPVVFAVEFGNMLSPSFTLSRTEEVTAIICLGQGQDANRSIHQALSTDALDSPWNRIEQSHDARNEDILGQESESAAALFSLQKTESFQFTVMQTSSSVYGRDYAVGDIVTLKFQDIQRDKKIIGANLLMSQGKETVSLEFSDVP